MTLLHSESGFKRKEIKIKKKRKEIGKRKRYFLSWRCFEIRYDNIVLRKNPNRKNTSNPRLHLDGDIKSSNLDSLIVITRRNGVTNTEYNEERDATSNSHLSYYFMTLFAFTSDKPFPFSLRFPLIHRSWTTYVNIHMYVYCMIPRGRHTSKSIFKFYRRSQII